MKVLIQVGGADQREREDTIPCRFMEEWQQEEEEVEEKKKQGEKSKTGTKREKEAENHFRSHDASFIWDIVVTCLSSTLIFSLCLFSSFDHFIGNMMLIDCLDAELHESLFPFLELHECNQIQVMLLCLGVPVLVFLKNFPALLGKHLRLTEPHFGWEVNRERTVVKINTSHSNLPNTTSLLELTGSYINFLLYIFFLQNYIHQ